MDLIIVDVFVVCLTYYLFSTQFDFVQSLQYFQLNMKLIKPIW